MGETTGISWAHHTFNPWWGCTKVSPGCDNCYADRDAARFGFSLSGAHFPIWGKDERRRFFTNKHWNQPLVWERKAIEDGAARVRCRIARIEGVGRWTAGAPVVHLSNREAVSLQAMSAKTIKKRYKYRQTFCLCGQDVTPRQKPSLYAIDAKSVTVKCICTSIVRVFVDLKR